MAKKDGAMGRLLSFIAWLTGVIVSLAVGFALVSGTLSVPWLGVVNAIAGWIVIITTLLGVLLAIAKHIQ